MANLSPDFQQTGAVFRLCVAVSPSDVIEVDPVLGDCVLHEPLRATSLFQAVRTRELSNYQ